MPARTPLLVLITCLLSLPGTLHAQPAGEPKPPQIELAERYAAEAYEAYERREYGVAIRLYRSSLAAAASADVLFNMARIYDAKLSDRARASELYTRYLEQPDAEPKRIELAQQRLAALHLLEQEEQRRSGQEAERRLSAQAAVDHQREDARRRRRASAIVIGSLGVASLALATGFGLAAWDRKRRVDDSCQRELCVSERGVRAAEDGTRMAHLSTATFITGGVLSTLGVGLWLWSRRPDDARAGTSVSWSPTLARGLVLTSMQTRW